MTELAVYESAPAWVDLMRPAAELAKQIVGTDFVPEAYRRNPAAIAACVMFGAEIGVPPMQSLNKIDVIKGRPAPRAELARALALAAGHDIWVEESTNTRVTVSGKRRGSDHVQTVTWTADDVKRAGLGANGNYAKYPRQMLLARASAELVRAMCPDALGGITIFAEEVGDADDGPMAEVAPAKTTTTRKRKAPDEMNVQTVAAHIPMSDQLQAAMAEVVEATTGPTQAQTRKAMACFNDLGITERQERLDLTSAYAGRDVSSWNDLTREEAGTVIDKLEQALMEANPLDNEAGEPALPGDELPLDAA